MGSKEENKVQKRLIKKTKKLLSYLALTAFVFNATFVANLVEVKASEVESQLIPVVLETPTLLSPADGVPVRGKLLVNDWTDVLGATSYDYESYNDEALTDLRWSENYSDSQKSANNVLDGTTFWWRVRAVDSLDNKSSWSDAWQVIVDNTSAEISNYFVEPASFSPNNDGIKDETTISYDLFTASYVSVKIYSQTEPEVLVKTFSVEEKLAGTNSLIWNGKNDADEVVSEGNYRIEVEVSEINGNPTVTVDLNVTVDLTGPQGTYGSAVNATNPTNNNNPEVYGKFYDNELSTASETVNYEVKKIEVVFDSGSEKYAKEAVINRESDTYSTKTSADFSVLAVPATARVLPDGTYKVSVLAYDEAGNWTEEVVVNSLVIDTKAPEAPQNLQVIQKTPTSVTLKWDKSTSLDTKGYIVYYGTQSGVYTSSLDIGNVLEYTVSGLKPQTNYYFAVKAYDGAMNLDKLSVEVSEVTPQEVRVASVVSDQTEDGQIESAQDEKVDETQDENKEEPSDESEKSSGFWWFIIISLAIVGAYWFWSRNPDWYKRFLKGKNPRIG